MSLDRHCIRQSFEKAAQSYQQHSVLQDEVQIRLLDRLSVVEKTPEVVLDLGCGPGKAVPFIQQQWPDSQIIAMDVAQTMLQGAQHGSMQKLCADTHGIPLQTASVDFIFSNLMLQWVLNLDLVFAEMRRILKPGGMVLLTTLGLETLIELKQAAFRADGGMHVNDFTDIREVGDRMLAAGFQNPVLDVDRITLTYSKVSGLLKDLKGVGAHNVRNDRQRTLTGKGFLQKLEQEYETFREDGVLPASYEVVYAMAWAPEQGQPWKVDGMDIAHISPDQIKKR